MNKQLYIALGLLLALIIIVIGILMKKRIEFFKQEKEFIKTEIHGVLTNIRDQQRGHFRLTIKESPSNNMIQYSIYAGKFFKENDIKENDSISKEANSYSVFFYRRKDTAFEKPVELYYN